MLRKLWPSIMALICFAIVVSAQTNRPDPFIGTWVMQLGERNLFVLDLRSSGAVVTGSMEGPAKFSRTNGAYANIRSGIRRDSIIHAELRDGVLHLTIKRANDSKDEVTYAMTVKGDMASLAFDDIPAGSTVPPLSFRRVLNGAKVASDWEPNRLYTTTDSDVSSPEMKAIYREDQRVRMDQTVNGKEIYLTDAQRRDQTKKLLDAGALHTGKDYEEAAFVFQHGDSANDYLLAHTLAMIAVSKGNPTAIWIASATLDRYLEKIGQKQIFGTQFSLDSQHGWTQEPYDRNLVSDALRGQLGVPSQDLQTKQLKALEAEK